MSTYKLKEKKERKEEGRRTARKFWSSNPNC
ncbi:hypothetical protein V6Z11_D01G114500 [Gossypium hirsutum]